MSDRKDKDPDERHAPQALAKRLQAVLLLLGLLLCGNRVASDPAHLMLAALARWENGANSSQDGSGREQARRAARMQSTSPNFKEAAV